MPYKCSKCGAEITAEFAAKTTDKFGEALCKSCVFDKNTGETKDEVEGAPSAPDEEPEQQTYSNGGKDNDVPVVKQPESDFNKAPNHVIRPFGDKSQFACKEIWRTDIKNQSESVTNSKIAAFRSRSVGQKTIIANMKISDDGVSIMEASR